MSSTFRLPEGGRVNRDAPVSFTFNGRSYEGLPWRHPGLGPARQRCPPGHDEHQAGPAPRHHGRRRRGPQRPRPGGDPLPRADAHRHHGRAVRRARGPWPARSGQARRPPRPGPLRRRARALRRARRRRRAGWARRRTDRGPVRCTGRPGGRAAGGRRIAARQPRRDRRRSVAGLGRCGGGRAERASRRHRPPADHGLRLLRRRLRPRPREAHRPPRTGRTGTPLPAAGLAHPVAARRGRHRRSRAPARLRRQRQAGHHARLVGPDLPAPLRRGVGTRGGGLHDRRQRVCRRGRPRRRRRHCSCRRRRAPSGPRPLVGAVRQARHRGPRGAGRDRHQRHRPGDEGARGAVRRGRARRAERDRLRPAPRVRRVEPRGAPVQPGPRKAALRRRSRCLRAGFDDPCGQRRGSGDGRAHPPRCPRGRGTGRRGGPRAARTRGRPVLGAARGGVGAGRRAHHGALVGARARPGRRLHAVRRPPAGRDRGRHPARHRRRAALGRARQALHDDRHRARPGQDLRRDRVRHRRRGPRSRRGRARDDDLPAAVHPGRLRGPRRPRPWRAARPGPRHPHPRLARDARRRVRERGPVEAALVLPAGEARTSSRPCCASARRPGAPSA